MKKILSVLLALTATLTLTACLPKTPGATPGGDAPNQEAKKDFESFSVEAVEYYLKETVDIELSEITPDWEYNELQKYDAYADDPASGYGHAVIQFTKTNGEVTDEEYNSWLAKVFDVTAKVSQDGYNIIGYEFVGEGEDALSETTLEAAMEGFMKGWGFRCNDKIMVVYVDREYDKEKESELGKIFYYDGVSFDLGVGLQKSFSDTMDEAEKYFEENEDEIKDALEDYLG